MKSVILKIFFIVTFLILLCPLSKGEDITLVSYYPSPKAIYKVLGVVGDGGVAPSSDIGNNYTLMRVGVPDATDVTVHALLEVGGVSVYGGEDIKNISIYAGNNDCALFSEGDVYGLYTVASKNDSQAIHAEASGAGAQGIHIRSYKDAGPAVFAHGTPESTNTMYLIHSKLEGGPSDGYAIYAEATTDTAGNGGSGIYVHTISGDNAIYTKSDGGGTAIHAKSGSGLAGKFEGDVEITGKANISNILHLTPQGSVPSPASEGDIYYDSTAHKLKIHDGTGWREVEFL